MRDLKTLVVQHFAGVVLLLCIWCHLVSGQDRLPPHVNQTVGFGSIVNLTSIDNNSTDGMVIVIGDLLGNMTSPSMYTVPHNGSITAFEAYFDINRVPRGRVRFLVWRPVFRNSSQKVTLKLVGSTSYKSVYPNVYDGVSYVKLGRSVIISVKQGDILALQYKGGANPVPYAVRPGCYQRTIKLHKNGSLPHYMTNSSYTFDAYISTCHWFSFRAVLSTFIKQNPPFLPSPPVASNCTHMMSTRQDSFLTSLNYSNPYPNYAFNQCVILDSRGYYYPGWAPIYVEIEYVDLDVCNRSSLEIWDGNTVLLHACRRYNEREVTIQRSFRSTGHNLTIKFSSSSNPNKHAGFKLSFRNIEWQTTTAKPSRSPGWMTTHPRNWTWPGPFTTTTPSVLVCEQKTAYPETVFSTYTSSSWLSSPNVILSPGYPADYPSDYRSCYIIEPAHYTDHIVLNFDMFEMETSYDCSMDYLEVRQGSSYYSPVWQRFCGRQAGSDGFPAMYLYTMPFPGAIYITFNSDATINYPGFRIRFYTGQPDVGCKDDLTASMYAMQLQYPSSNIYDYKIYEDECWVISSDYSQVIKLDVLHLDIEYSFECSSDYLMVRDGTDKDAPVLQKYCGHDPSAYLAVQSTSSGMFLRFSSDGSLGGTGFIINYRAVRRETAQVPCQKQYAYEFYQMIEFPAYYESPRSQGSTSGNNGAISMCWTIESNQYHYGQVYLEVNNIELKGSNCATTSLHILDGDYDGDETVLRTYCPNKYYSYDEIKVYDTIKIQLITDNAGSNSHFSMSYYVRYDPPTDLPPTDKYFGPHQFPTWTIALIVIGVLIFLALIIVVPASVSCCYRRRQRLRQQPLPQPPVQVGGAAGQTIAFSSPVYAMYNPTTGSVVLPPGGANIEHGAAAAPPIQHINTNNTVITLDEPGKTKL